MDLPEISKQIFKRVCEIMDVPPELGIQSPQVLEACRFLELGLLVSIDTKTHCVKVLQGEMPEA
jgi:hypothetical protein